MDVVMELDIGTGMDEPTVQVADLPARAEGEPELAELVSWWGEQVLAPFLAAQPVLSAMQLGLKIQHLGELREFTVDFGVHHLEDLAAAYGNFGWEAVALVEPRVKEGKSPEAVRFHRLTRRVLELMIGQALVRIERRAAEYAKSAWAKARSNLVTYQEAFHPPLPGWRTLGIRFRTKTVQADLIKHCHDYAVALEEASRLGEKMADRDRKDPPKHRVKGSGAALWYQVYADAQEAELAKMHAAFLKIQKVFPAAALVLDDLPEEIRTDPEKRELPYILAVQIHQRIVGLVAELDRLKVAVERLAPDTEWITFEKPSTEETTDPGISRVEARTVDVALAKGREELGVLANPYLLAEFAEQNEGGAWDRVVLRCYRARLASALEAQRQEHMSWKVFWDVIGRVAAALSLLALCALVPGAPAALAAALGVLGYAATVLGLVMLLVHEILGTLAAAGTVEAEARAQLFRLGRDDPEALRTVGALVAQSTAMRRALGDGLLSILFRIGLARFKVLAAAIELEGAVDDLETLFGPSPVPEPPVPEGG